MYAFISNEYKTIVYTQRQLDFLCSIYSYPSFVKINSTEEAKQFFIRKDRDFIRTGISKYGKQTKVGYIAVEYFIDGNNVYYNLYTEKFGFIKFTNFPSNVICDSGYDLIKLKFKNVSLNNDLIAHHCTAIQLVLRFIGDFINVELRLPDESIYLALTKYTGKNYSIKNTQSLIKGRLAETYYTVKKGS